MTAKMLSGSELLAVLTVLQLKELPEHLEGCAFVEILTHRDVMEKRQMILDLRDKIDGLSQDAVELKTSVETLVYKIKDEPICKVRDWFEFKEVKARLGIY